MKSLLKMLMDIRMLLGVGIGFALQQLAVYLCVLLLVGVLRVLSWMKMLPGIRRDIFEFLLRLQKHQKAEQMKQTIREV